MTRWILALLCAGLLAGAAMADAPRQDTPVLEEEEVLPRWMTPAERLQPLPPSMDEITPPPDNPVYLEGEFEPKDGMLLRWPFSFDDMFASMVDEIQDVANVYIIVSNSSWENNCIQNLADHGVGLENVTFIHAPTNAIWMRDYGPWFVDDQGQPSIVDIRYYPTRPQDDNIPNVLHDHWETGYYGPNIYHEGGNMMNDGHGTMMMSTRVLDANPGMSQQQVEDIYQDYFGQDNTHIFQRIFYDGTGHIDIWSKIVNDNTILVADFDESDPNHDRVNGHVAVMDDIPTHDGGTFDIVRIPMLPRSGNYYRTHTNSILINNKAIIPIYNAGTDAQAIAAYQTALGPGWDVVGIDCNAISPLGGQIHCVTMEVPTSIQPLASIELIPAQDIVVIPWGGGSFQFHAVLTNLTDMQLPGQGWTEVHTPNNTVYGPILLTNINMSPNQTITTGTFTQYVPGGVPGGTYQYVAKVGVYPDMVAAEDSFEFLKSGIGSTDDTEWRLVEDGAEIAADDRATAPSAFQLGEAYPNPFNPTTALNVTLPAAAELTVTVHDITGREVATLASGRHAAGEHRLVLDGSRLASGVYLVRAVTPGHSPMMRKVTLIK